MWQGSGVGPWGPEIEGPRTDRECLTASMEHASLVVFQQLPLWPGLAISPGPRLEGISLVKRTN